jgi:hypothetical protein
MSSLIDIDNRAINSEPAIKLMDNLLANVSD